MKEFKIGAFVVVFAFSLWSVYSAENSRQNIATKQCQEGVVPEAIRAIWPADIGVTGFASWNSSRGARYDGYAWSPDGGNSAVTGLKSRLEKAGWKDLSNSDYIIFKDETESLSFQRPCPSCGSIPFVAISRTVPFGCAEATSSQR
jgi:hypothetical protein